VSVCGVSCTAKTLICAAYLWALAGCAAVKIGNADGTQEISIHPFKMEIVSRSTESPQLIKTSMLGLSSTASGFDVGLRNEEIAVAPAKCHAVFIVRSEAQASTASRLAKLVEESCLIQQ
jgi:hypothetical protein